MLDIYITLVRKLYFDLRFHMFEWQSAKIVDDISDTYTIR